MSSSDLEIGDQRACAMADVVGILPLDGSGDGKAGWRRSLQGLDSGLLVAAHDMNAAFVKDRRAPVEVTDLFRGCIERLLVDWVQLRPVAHAVRSKVDLLLKNDPRIGSRCS